MCWWLCDGCVGDGVVSVLVVGVLVVVWWRGVLILYPQILFQLGRRNLGLPVNLGLTVQCS